MSEKQIPHSYLDAERLEVLRVLEVPNASRRSEQRLGGDKMTAVGRRQWGGEHDRESLPLSRSGASFHL